ncbi:hypothetical protein HDU98_004673 [Podochytrium sp. JEL0797]|nr:hypothetical protein HDU98_004673 [Podochytrium sp. JEL0797]
MKRPSTSAAVGNAVASGNRGVNHATAAVAASSVHLAAAKIKRYEAERSGSGANSALFRPLPSLGSALPLASEHEVVGGGGGSGKKQGGSSSAVVAGAAVVVNRGKLLCCLKVEIKTGVFRMLPVHENDNAHELSYEFCKTNSLLNSVEALSNHVTLSKSTFSGNK